MTNTSATFVRVPRETLAARIDALPLGKAKAYADFIRKGDPGSPVPCWGAITQRFVDGCAQRLISTGHRYDLGTEQSHPSDVRRLSLHVDGTHVYRTGQAKARTGSGTRHTVLTRTRFGDDAPRTEALRQ